MNLNKSLKLYAVSDRSWCQNEDLITKIEKAIKGGITFLQLREKNLNYNEFLNEAILVKKLCSKYNIPFVINDNINIAMASDADGVHLGQDDFNPKIARDLIGSNKILGISVNTVSQALKAQADGANYLGVGAVFSTNTKTNTKNVSYDTLKNICDAVNIPVVAIGGINENNICKLKNSNIKGIAVVSAIFASNNVEKSTKILLNEVKKYVN